jgi:hypothetical protein
VKKVVVSTFRGVPNMEFRHPPTLQKPVLQTSLRSALSLICRQYGAPFEDVALEMVPTESSIYPYISYDYRGDHGKYLPYMTMLRRKGTTRTTKYESTLVLNM